MLVLMPMLADIFRGWEVVLILAAILILFGAKHLPKIGREWGDGLSKFRKEFDQQAHEAGEGLGGIYGKPAGEALTTDNQTAELYDPAVFHGEERTRRTRKQMRFRGWPRLWRLCL